MGRSPIKIGVSERVPCKSVGNIILYDGSCPTLFWQNEPISPGITPLALFGFSIKAEARTAIKSVGGPRSELLGDMGQALGVFDNISVC